MPLTNGPADTPAVTAEAARKLRGAFNRYRVMSYVVGTMLLIMVLIGLPLQYAWHQPKPAGIGWTVHGAFYIVYLLSAADLARQARFTLGQILGVVTAGFLPGLAFVVERRTAARILGSGAAPPAP